MSINRTIELPVQAKQLAAEKDFELAGHVLGKAFPEDTRAPRIVRVGLIQNKIVTDTSAPVTEQVSSSF